MLVHRGWHAKSVRGRLSSWILWKDPGCFGAGSHMRSVPQRSPNLAYFGVTYIVSWLHLFHRSNTQDYLSRNLRWENGRRESERIFGQSVFFSLYCSVWKLEWICQYVKQNLRANSEERPSVSVSTVGPLFPNTWLMRVPVQFSHWISMPTLGFYPF